MAGRRSYLKQLLNSHIETLEETFQILDTPAESSLEKTDWSQVTEIGDAISKQATITGMLWNGEARELNELEESMGTYFNLLNGFLLLCHGSSAGAGPTLHSRIHSSAKQVMDCSLSVLRAAVSSYDSSNSSNKLTIPQLTGSVWEACTVLKKTPTTNCKAILHAMTQVAISIKDILREMKELKLAIATSSSDNETEPKHDNFDDELSDEDLEEDLSPEEMNIAVLIADVASNSLDTLKELIKYIMGSIEESQDHVDFLERLLGCCNEIGSQVNELGAGVYPPQDVSEMNETAEKISSSVSDIHREVKLNESAKGALCMVLEELDCSLGRLKSGLDLDLGHEMGKLVL